MARVRRRFPHPGRCSRATRTGASSRAQGGGPLLALRRCRLDRRVLDRLREERSMTTKELLLSAWDPGGVVPLLCVLALAAYLAHFRRRLEPRSAFFVLAVALFFVALASPIGVLARGYLFSAHMLQHLLLMLGVPPLVFLGLPRTRRRAHPRGAGVVAYGGAWLAGVGAMWIWHAPMLCNAAAVSTTVQWCQTGSLLAMGLAFWRPILAPRLPDRLPVFSGILYLFAACVACTVLGIMVT